MVAPTEKRPKLRGLWQRMTEAVFLETVFGFTLSGGRAVLPVYAGAYVCVKGFKRGVLAKQKH